jgi:peptide/nickel transport system substrate-binding protein
VHILTRRGAWLGALVASGLALAACSGGTTDSPTDGETAAAGAERPEGVTANDYGGEALAIGDPVQGGSLTAGLSATLETLDPTGPINQSLSTVASQIYDSLMAFDAEGSAVPDLVESLDSEDLQTWIMTLPEGVTFTDATPFDAHAVIAHLTNLAAEGSQSQAAGDVRRIQSMTAIDDHTIEFTLGQPWAGFPSVFARGSAAYVPSPTAFAERGQDFGLNPVGAGPFLVQSFQSGGNLVLTRNPDYRVEGLPYLDTVTFVPALETESRLAGITAGDLDIGHSRSADEADQAEQAGLTVLDQPDLSFSNVLLNLAQPPLDDVRFRRAIFHALDLDALNAAVFAGKHEPMRGMFPPDHPFYVETDWPQYDVEAARQLVEEYTADTGQPAEFDLVMPPPPDMQRQATIIQQMLGDAGITANLIPQDNPTMVSRALAGEYGGQVRYIAVLAETDRVLRQNFYSQSPGNNGQLGDAEFDELLEQALTAEDDERAAIYEEMQLRFAQWLPMVPLLLDDNSFFVGSTVGGFPGSQDTPWEGLDWERAWAIQE